MDLFGELRWRFQVWRNRRRHPDLLRREKEGAFHADIVDQMLVRDRDKMFEQGISPSDPRYPDRFDYTTVVPYRVVRRRRAECVADFKALKERERANNPI